MQFLPMLAVVVGLGFAGPAPVHADSDSRAAPRRSTPADEIPRPADERLRAGMLDLRALLAQGMEGGQPVAEADYVALAAKIEQQVQAISAGRDFHNRAGRHLQWLLGDITDGVQLMRDAPRAPAKRLGLMRVVETLNYYGREYDHPGWEPLKP